MQLECPFCGARDLHEYHFLRTFAPLDVALDAGFAAVYERDNSVDRSLEYWQHRHGCQAWLVVERNPSSGEVLDVRLLRRDRQ